MKLAMVYLAVLLSSIQSFAKGVDDLGKGLPASLVRAEGFRNLMPGPGRPTHVPYHVDATLAVEFCRTVTANDFDLNVQEVQVGGQEIVLLTLHPKAGTFDCFGPTHRQEVELGFLLMDKKPIVLTNPALGEFSEAH